MAEVTVTNRTYSTRGSLRVETGEFTKPGDDFQIYTRLARVVSFRVRSKDNTDHDGPFYINSDTAATDANSGFSAEDDPGHVHLVVAQFTGDDYTYEAVGF